MMRRDHSVTVSFSEDMRDMRALKISGHDMSCGKFRDPLPQFRIQIGEKSRIADLENVSGPDLTFSYTVKKEDRDPDGISIRENSIAMPCGAFLRDDVGNGGLAKMTPGGNMGRSRTPPATP